METREVTSIAGLIEFARHMKKRAGALCWYRGHCNADWNLVPYVHRNPVPGYEFNVIVQFQLGAPTRYTGCPSTRDIVDWLPLMQHYGLPTRLLDWTDSILVAAFFAIGYEKSEGNAALWALIPYALNDVFFQKRVVPTMEHPGIRDLATGAVGEGPPTNKVCAVLPYQSDLRMTLQMGRFTMHGDPTPLEQHVDSQKYLEKVIIPESARAEMLEDMKCLGINRASLFPDLHHLAQHIAGLNFVSPDSLPGTGTPGV